MFKKIMFTGILLISISALNAKNFSPTYCIFAQNTTPTDANCDEALLNKIIADNDFKNYYISNVEFANKIIETKAGNLFQKYIQKTITNDEQLILFAKMGLTSKKDFDDIAVKLKNEALVFFNKFPELKLITEKEQKELLLNAFKKLSTDNSIRTKFVKVRTVTVEQCFWWWMACNTACFIGCSYSEGNACYWECSAFCAGEYGLCWFTAGE